MKPNQNLSPDYLTGKWRVTAFYLNTNVGWKLTKQYGLNSFLWEFDSNGQLIEKRKDNADFITRYEFYSSQKELIIDRTGMERGNILSLGNRYSIQGLNDSECWLCDMESLTHDGKQSKYRMKIRRLQ